MKLLILSILLCKIYLANSIDLSIEKRLNPIIIVPGLAGSQLQAKLNMTNGPCPRKTDFYFTIWLRLLQLLPLRLDCFVDYMKLIYDNSTRTTKNNPGVTIRVPGFGKTTNIEFLDELRLPVSKYFVTLIDELVKMGYQKDINILGAPYDFRKAPNELGDYYKSFLKLIEDSYQKNNNSKVILVGHSMGCPVTHYFLLDQSQEWKDKYIKSFIALAPAWLGGGAALKALVLGLNLGIFYVPEYKIRDDQRTWPSVIYLLPSDTIWPKDEVILELQEKNYTVRNYKDFFQDLNFTQGYDIWLNVRNLTQYPKPPGVEVHCLYGTGVKTLEKIVFKEWKILKWIPISKVIEINGDGDGFINLRSLSACLKWKEEQKQDIIHKTYLKLDHMKIVHDKRIIDYIKKQAIN